jgi:hypothetical protein
MCMVDHTAITVFCEVADNLKALSNAAHTYMILGFSLNMYLNASNQSEINMSVKCQVECLGGHLSLP